MTGRPWHADARDSTRSQHAVDFLHYSDKLTHVLQNVKGDNLSKCFCRKRPRDLIEIPDHIGCRIGLDIHSDCVLPFIPSTAYVKSITGSRAAPSGSAILSTVR